MVSNIILLLIRGVGYSFRITIYYIGPLLAIIIKNKIKYGRRRYRFSLIG